MIEKFILIAFDSTHMAIKVEKLLSGLDVDIIPTPRELTAACGISIKASIVELDAITERIGDDYGNLNTFYEVIKEGKKLTFNKL